MGDPLQAAQQEIAKLAAENKKLQGQVVQAADAIKEVQDQLRASKGPVVNATSFTVPSDGNFLVPGSCLGDSMAHVSGRDTAKLRRLSTAQPLIPSGSLPRGA